MVWTRIESIIWSLSTVRPIFYWNHRGCVFLFRWRGAKGVTHIQFCGFATATASMLRGRRPPCSEDAALARNKHFLQDKMRHTPRGRHMALEVLDDRPRRPHLHSAHVQRVFAHMHTCETFTDTNMSFVVRGCTTRGRGVAQGQEDLRGSETGSSTIRHAREGSSTIRHPTLNPKP